jgi:hypothetical protein
VADFQHFAVLFGAFLRFWASVGGRLGRFRVGCGRCVGVTSWQSARRGTGVRSGTFQNRWGATLKNFFLKNLPTLSMVVVIGCDCLGCV